MISVLLIEIDFHRNDKIDRGDQRRHIGKQGRHVVLRRPEEEALGLYANVGIPHDDQVCKHADDHKETGKRQGKERIDPLQKGKRALVRFGKISCGKVSFG